MGPVITPASKQRIGTLIAQGTDEGAEPVLDGRDTSIRGYEQGNFVSPTILDGVPPASNLADTEIFGPALTLLHAKDVDEAIGIISQNRFGNASSIFTASGAAARKFRNQIPTLAAGMVSQVLARLSPRWDHYKSKEARKPSMWLEPPYRS
jgi:malonate-semialdehyde dehydrogenase (acetylating) / methylmalonate-semialdehyde dehydrogenase